MLGYFQCSEEYKAPFAIRGGEQSRMKIA